MGALSICYRPTSALVLASDLAKTRVNSVHTFVEARGLLAQGLRAATVQGMKQALSVLRDCWSSAPPVDVRRHVRAEHVYDDAGALAADIFSSTKEGDGAPNSVTNRAAAEALGDIAEAFRRGMGGTTPPGATLVRVVCTDVYAASTRCPKFHVDKVHCKEMLPS